MIQAWSSSKKGQGWLITRRCQSNCSMFLLERSVSRTRLIVRCERSMTLLRSILCSTVLFNINSINADAYAGHSLGEFSALSCSGSLIFEDALKLVFIRARAMQKACKNNENQFKTA